MNRIPPDDAILAPDNEPYFGSPHLRRFDEHIVSILEANDRLAPSVRELKKTEIQRAACQLIPEAISLALSIRELIRHGYLFGAFMLIRPLAERVTILLYLEKNPLEIKKWAAGWLGVGMNRAPGFAEMLEDFMGKGVKGFTAPLNDLIHGKPGSAHWSLRLMDEKKFGHSAFRCLDNPNFCDTMSRLSVSWISILMERMFALFPDQLGTQDWVSKQCEVPPETQAGPVQ